MCFGRPERTQVWTNTLVPLPMPEIGDPAVGALGRGAQIAEWNGVTI
jgi:hypothetical protein